MLLRTGRCTAPTKGCHSGLFELRSTIATPTAGASDPFAGFAHSGRSPRRVLDSHVVHPSTTSEIQVRKAGLEQSFRLNTWVMVAS